MGIQDRDYYRDGTSFFDRVGQQGATVWLIAITVGVFLGQYVPGSPLTQLGCYDSRLIREGEVWRLLTSAFLHADLFHLFFNMLVLYWAGLQLEELYGSREFVIFYLLGAIVANAFRIGMEEVGLALPTQALGASGAVSAVFILFACHFPHAQVRLWFLLPVPAWILALFYVVIAAFSGLGGAPARGGIGHLAHLGGAAFGFLYFQSGFRFTTIFSTRRETARVRPRLRVLSPPVELAEPELSDELSDFQPRTAKPADEQLEAKLDAVLEKVARYGQASLTAEEREILFKASDVYKKRRK